MNKCTGITILKLVDFLSEFLCVCPDSLYVFPFIHFYKSAPNELAKDEGKTLIVFCKYMTGLSLGFLIHGRQTTTLHPKANLTLHFGVTLTIFL